MNLDLFTWANTVQPRTRQPVQRLGWLNCFVSCRIGTSWWFSPYLVMPDQGKIVPDLKTPITFMGRQERPD